jgi:2-methylcitrate dehydratase PrpD
MGQDTTETLARFAATLTFEAIPQSARDASKMLLLDALACALAGHQGEETGEVRALAEALARSRETSIIGGDRLSLAGATLMNGFLITAVTMCDTHRSTLSHITPEVVPPALAIAERDGVSGRELLTALAAGCEITTRIGLGLDYPEFRRRGWHGPGVVGPFGAAASVGRLLHFDTDTMARAFGLAGSQAAGTFAAWGTPTVKFHQCRGALSGLMAALLAQQDFVATREFLTAPDGGLYNTYSDGGRPEDAVADLGKRWELEQIALRLWPSASLVQSLITALFDLVDSRDIAPADVESVRIALPTTPFELHGIFATYKAKFEALLSAHYIAAVILHDRALTLAQFEPARYDDPALRAFAAERVSVVDDPSLQGNQAVVEIRMRSGETLAERCEHPRGAPENPVAFADIEAKFRTYAGTRLAPAQVESTLDAVCRLEDLPDARILVDGLRVDQSNPRPDGRGQIALTY